MRWFGWFRGSAYHGGALTNPDKGEQANRPEPTTTSANLTVTDERAMQVSTVFACTRLIATTCAALPLGFYARTADGRNELDRDHQLWRLLKYKPNSFMTALDFRQAMFTQRVLWGNGYAYIERKNDRPVSLTPLKPEFMAPYRDGNSVVYRYSTDNGVKEFSQREIFHLKGFSTDGVTGMSALGYARQSLGLSVAADESASKSIGGRANAVLELEDVPTPAQKAKLREMYGKGNDTSEFQSDGQLMITPGGMKYRAISLPPDDLQLLESRQFQVPEICRFFGVPAVMVDGAAGATAAWPASYEQQMQSFLTFTLKPYLDEFEDKVVDSLLAPSEARSVFAEHRVEGLLRADSAGRSAFYSQMVQNGIMTRAEVRAKENLPEIAGADELTVQVNMTSLDNLPKVQSNVVK